MVKVGIFGSEKKPGTVLFVTVPGNYLNVVPLLS